MPEPLDLSVIQYLLFSLFPYFIFPFSMYKARWTYPINRFSKMLKT